MVEEFKRAYLLEAYKSKKFMSTLQQDFYTTISLTEEGTQYGGIDGPLYNSQRKLSFCMIQLAYEVALRLWVTSS